MMRTIAMQNGVCGAWDNEAAKILDDFLPAKLFDAHMHLYPEQPAQTASPGSLQETFPLCTRETYLRHMTQIVGQERSIAMNLIPFPFPAMKDRRNGQMERSHRFLLEQLPQDGESCCEILVMPDDTAEDIAARLISPAIRGLKCYHAFAGKPKTWDCNIGEYLPRSAWEVAQQRHLCITLHMVKDLALSDEENMRYIQTMARRYPDARLILAHAARGFAAWTTVEAVEQLTCFDNVWFDVSSVCESPAIFQILRKIGSKRCLWGSDYPVSALRGKAISLADGFYWIYLQELEQFAAHTEGLHTWLIGTETLMAIRQACIMAELGAGAVEDIFYRNARFLFSPSAPA